MTIRAEAFGAIKEGQAEVIDGNTLLLTYHG